MNKMKAAILGSSLIFLLTLNGVPAISAEPELGGGRISLIQGQVLIQSKDEGGWTEAFVNFPIMDGDRIMTERDGRVELHFKNGTYVRVGEISQLDMIALNGGREKGFIHLHQLEGKIYVNHHPITEEASSLFVDLPYGVVSAYVPTKFRIDLTPSEARISVLEGSVELMRDGKPISLTQGKTLIAQEGGYAEVATLYRKDEWDQWNEARDYELLQRRYAQNYLPSELEPYGYEMEGNGRWVYTPEYQYVWVPTVVVGWTPFHYGHWAWRRGVYCWVPREPWGWIPFHYGRWFHLHSHGWAWVPPFRHAVIWHPGAVAWQIGSTYVSWVPLAPGEIYYGHGDYGPNSVNINRVSINIQKNVYINAQVKNAVVTVHGDSFNKRNPSKITSVENPFLKPAKVSGPPTGKPVLLEGKKTPVRPVQESFERIQQEVRPSPKVINQRQIVEGRDKKVGSDTARNQVERIEWFNRQTGSTQENGVKKESTPVLRRENVKKGSSVPNGGSSRNIPNVSPYPQSTPNQNVSTSTNQERLERMRPSNSNQGNLERRVLPSPQVGERTQVKSPNPIVQSPQRNTSVNINQNRFERAEQQNAFPGSVGKNQSSFPSQEGTRVESSTPVHEVMKNRGMSSNLPSQIQSFPQRQEGRANAARPSLPEVRLPSAPASTGQVIQPNRGSTGGFSGPSPMRSFR